MTHLNIIANLNSFIDKAIKDSPRLSKMQKNERISKSLKKYHKEHGNTRRIPVNEYGRLSYYIYLNK
jgi:hypothetical protein